MFHPVHFMGVTRVCARTCAHVCVDDVYMCVQCSRRSKAMKMAKRIS